MLRPILPMLALLLVALPACTKSVCETKNDCPVGNMCSGGVCIPACTADTDCPDGKFCDRPTGLCQLGCRGSSECVNGEECVKNQCRSTSSAPSVDGGPAGGEAVDAGLASGGLDGGGPPICNCVQAPAACLYDINPASATMGKLVCEPAVPPRAGLLFFGNIGCSHCQSIFGNLLLIEAELRSEGLDPTLVFVQLKDWTYAGDAVTSTFPTHKGPVLQDTATQDLWHAYGAEWYDAKIIDSRGCLSALFASGDTQNLIANGELQEPGKLLKDAWRSAMGAACHAPPDAAVADEVGR